MHYLDAQIPFYIYKIQCLPTGEYYWGSRTHHARLGLLPEQDLWIKYFTSSKIVNQLIQQYGTENFVPEIVYKSYDANEIYWQEQELIKSTCKDTKCLNQYYIDKATARKSFSCFGRTKEKHPLYNLPKEKNPNYGSKRSATQRANIAANHAPCAGANNSRALKWRLTSPDNQITEIHGTLQKTLQELGISSILLKRHLGRRVPPGPPSGRKEISVRTVGWMLEKI